LQVVVVVRFVYICHLVQHKTYTKFILQLTTKFKLHIYIIIYNIHFMMILHFIFVLYLDILG